MCRKSANFSKNNISCVSVFATCVFVRQVTNNIQIAEKKEGIIQFTSFTQTLARPLPRLRPANQADGNETSSKVSESRLQLSLHGAEMLAKARIPTINGHGVQFHQVRTSPP